MATAFREPPRQSLSGYRIPEIPGQQRTTDYPATINGKLVNARTGKPWVGTVPNTVQRASGAGPLPMSLGGGLIKPWTTGTEEPEIKPWTVTRTPKNPALSTAIDALLAKQQNNSATASKMFEAALKASPQDPAQLVKDQAVFDTAGIDRELRGINRDYEMGQNAVSGDIAQRNRDYESFTSGNTDRLRLENDAAIANINAATQAAAARAMGYANAVDVVSGNTNASGAGINQRARRLADLSLAAEGRISDRRYNLIGQEQNLGREIYGNDQALLGRQSSLEADFAGRAGSTAQYLQDLKMRTAGKVSAVAQQYLEDALRRVQMGLALGAEDIARIGQIQQLDQQANWYEVNRPFDPNQLPVVTSAAVLNPERNYTGTNVTNTGTQGTPQSSQQFTPPAARDRSNPVNKAYWEETGFWPDQQFDQARWNTIFFRFQNQRNQSNRLYTPQRPLSTTFEPTPSSGAGRVNDTFMGTDAYRNYNLAPGY